MCLAIPAKVLAISENIAEVDMLGNITSAEISLLQEVQVGDYVMVHAGFAIQKYDYQEAQLTLQLFNEMVEKIDDRSAPV